MLVKWKVLYQKIIWAHKLRYEHVLQVIKLSDAVQNLPRQSTCFCHGVPKAFLDVGVAMQASKKDSELGKNGVAQNAESKDPVKLSTDVDSDEGKVGIDLSERKGKNVPGRANGQNPEENASSRHESQSGRLSVCIHFSQQIVFPGESLK